MPPAENSEARRSYGTVERLDDGRWRLRFTRRLEHPPARVWAAVTEPEHLLAWFPTTIECERAAGAPLRFAFPKGQAEPFGGEMLAFEPPHLMELLWGEDVVRIELVAVDGGTELTLLDTLGRAGKAARDAAGWHTCLDALQAHLAGGPGARDAMSRWRELHTVYVESLGPEGATIGPPQEFE
jgi:uncharacterized protein YndB with AHSA1/START domain